jgi:hypothetical protein
MSLQVADRFFYWLQVMHFGCESKSFEQPSSLKLRIVDKKAKNLKK